MAVILSVEILVVVLSYVLHGKSKLIQSINERDGLKSLAKIFSLT